MIMIDNESQITTKDDAEVMVETESTPVTDIVEPTPNRNAAMRGEDGRFLPGNAGGPGNPLMGRVTEMLIMGEVMKGDGERLKAVVVKMLDLAKAGDVAAARLVLEYSIGKPPQAITVQADAGPTYKVLIGIDEGML